MPVRRLTLPRPLRRPSLLVNLALAALVLGGAGWAYAEVWQPTASEGNTGGTSSRTVAVAQGAVTATATADGTVASASTASADFITSGTVTEVRVKVGDKVKKGQVLAKVDPTSANRDLARTEADLTAAQDALARAEDADEDTSELEAQVTQAQLDVDEAQDAVDGTVLKAPMAGTVVAVSGTVGSSSGGSSGSSGGSSGSSGGSSGGGSSGGGSSGSGSSSGSSSGDGFVEIADLTKLEVSASFAEADATKIKVGQSATVTWNALTDTSVTGKVTAIDPSATTSNNVVTYGVTVDLDDFPDEARVGQTTSVEVVTGQAENAIYVPSAAVTTSGGRSRVTVVANGAQTVTVVEVGLEGDTYTEITSGLTVGQLVLVTTSTSSSSGSGGTAPGGGLTGGGLTGGGGFTGGGTGPGGGGFSGGGTRGGGR